MNNPSYSVIIPVYNGDQFLAGAINNVLAQMVSPLEIIVVDDGSTDDTAKVAAHCIEHHLEHWEEHHPGSPPGAVQIRYISQSRQGPSSARNRGFREASGDLIAFLDCDDLWPEDNLASLTEALSDDVDIVLGKIQEQHYDPLLQRWVNSRELTFSPSLVAMLVRRSLFEAVGLLDETLHIAEDKDWFYRAREQGKTIKYLDDHVALYHRRHQDNSTNDMASSESYLLDLMRRSLRRRGALKA